MPSSGSTSHRTPPEPAASAPSSATIASSGRSAAIMPTISASASRSVSLTRSVRLVLEATPLAGSPARSSSRSPAARAAPDREPEERLAHARCSDDRRAATSPGASRCGKCPTPGSSSSRPSGRAPASQRAPVGGVTPVEGTHHDQRRPREARRERAHVERQPAGAPVGHGAQVGPAEAVARLLEQRGHLAGRRSSGPGRRPPPGRRRAGARGLRRARAIASRASGRPTSGSCRRSEIPRGGQPAGPRRAPRAPAGPSLPHPVRVRRRGEHRHLGAQRVRRPARPGRGRRPAARARRASASGVVRRRRGVAPNPGRSTATTRSPAAGERGGQPAPPLLEAVEPVDQEDRRARARLDGRRRAHGGTIRGRRPVPWARGREARTRRTARLLRRRGPRHRDRRAGARGARPAGVRARGDRAQHARRRRRSPPRARCSWTSESEVPEGETIILSAHGVSPEVRRVCAEREPARRSTPPARWSPRSTPRCAASPAAGRPCCWWATATTTRSSAPAGEAPDAVILIESVDDAETVEVPDPSNVALTTQTTLSIDDTTEIVDVLKRRFPALVGPQVQRHLLRDPEPPGRGARGRRRRRRPGARRRARATPRTRTGWSRSPSAAGADVAPHRQRLRARPLLARRARRRVALTAGASAPEVLVQEVATALVERRLRRAAARRSRRPRASSSPSPARLRPGR